MFNLTDVPRIVVISSNKGLVIKYGRGGGLQNEKIAGPKVVVAPPLKTG